MFYAFVIVYSLYWAVSQPAASMKKAPGVALPLLFLKRPGSCTSLMACFLHMLWVVELSSGQESRIKTLNTRPDDSFSYPYMLFFYFYYTILSISEIIHSAETIFS